MAVELFSLETRLIHAGEKPDPSTGSVAPVLHRTKTYAQTPGVESKYKYSRGRHPDRDALCEKLVSLEGKGFATVYSSGLAAETALLMTLKPGDHVLCCHEVYGGTYRLFDKIFRNFNITADYVDFSNEADVKKHIRQDTRYFLVETPTNPSLHILDLEHVNRISLEYGIPWIADMTFSPPCATRAFEYGAKVVVHSLSKYIAGHNDVLAGTIITDDPRLHEKLELIHKATGAILSPDEIYRVLQGSKTLAMRWERSSRNAMDIATFLDGHPKIQRVLYPGLVSNTDHLLAKKQMGEHFGSVVSFEVKGDSDRMNNFIHAAIEDGIIIYGESLASPETILAYPPVMSHVALSREERYRLGITDGFFRLSLGWESSKDILHVLDKSLSRL